MVEINCNKERCEKGICCIFEECETRKAGKEPFMSLLAVKQNTQQRLLADKGKLLAFVPVNADEDVYKKSALTNIDFEIEKVTKQISQIMARPEPKVIRNPLEEPKKPVSEPVTEVKTTSTAIPVDVKPVEFKDKEKAKKAKKR